MTAFQRTIICFGLVIGFFWFFATWRTPDMTMVYPDNCVFVIDPFFSRAMQLEIKEFIDAAYKKNKNPANLLPKIESHFPAIKSVVIDMSSLAQATAGTQKKGIRGSGEALAKDDNSKVLNFSIRTYQPIFLINDEHVICEGGIMLSKANFAQEPLSKIENIVFEGVPVPKNINRLMTFFESLTQSESSASRGGKNIILQDFSVRWVNKHAIWLDQKEKLQNGNYFGAIAGKDEMQGQDLSLLVGYDTVPNEDDIRQCRSLRGQIVDKPCKGKRGKPCKNNTTWVCDLRFDQQIVLFSTNKGV